METMKRVKIQKSFSRHNVNNPMQISQTIQGVANELSTIDVRINDYERAEFGVVSLSGKHRSITLIYFAAIQFNSIIQNKKSQQSWQKMNN